MNGIWWILLDFEWILVDFEWILVDFGGFGLDFGGFSVDLSGLCYISVECRRIDAQKALFCVTK